VVGGGLTVLAPAALAAAGFGVGIAKGSAAAFMASYGQSIVCPSLSFCLFLIISMDMTAVVVAVAAGATALVDGIDFDSSVMIQTIIILR
jgi:hypothetical protein